jgi:cyclomaltodextrinase
MKGRQLWPLLGAALAVLAVAVTFAGRPAGMARAAIPAGSPNWLKHAVIYEIFPDRFFDGAIQYNENPVRQLGVGSGPGGAPMLVPIAFHGNWSSLPYDPSVTVPPAGSPSYAQARALYGDGQWNLDFFGGNLPGIILKLDYLQSLGVNTLYLTPIFQADTNHKYDTGNFKLIDPGFGTLADFHALIRAAKVRSMHIILDGVFEDTGSNSLYFNQFGTYRSVGAWQEYQKPSRHSPYWNWYLQDPVYKNPFMTWNGVSTLILTNTASRGWQRFVYGAYNPHDPTNPAKNSVAAYWLGQGISGWRLDSADNSNFSPAWWQAFRRAVKRLDPNAAIIGEIWTNPTTDNGVNWLTNHTFDSVMNYPFQEDLLGFFRGNYNAGNETFLATNAAGLSTELMAMARQYPRQAYYAMMNVLDSQDTMRVLTVLENAPGPGTITALQQALWQPTPAEARLGQERLYLLTDLQFTWPGAPTIWYGDEAGLTGYSDPLDRRTFPWGHENFAILTHYRELGAIRASLPVLATGTLTPLYARGKVFAYLRQIEGGRDVFGKPALDGSAITVLNNQGRAVTVTLNLTGHHLRDAGFRDLLAPGAPRLDAVGNRLLVHLAPWQGRILVEAAPRPVAWIRQAAASLEWLQWTPVPEARTYRVILKGPGQRHTLRVTATRLDLSRWLGANAWTVVVKARGRSSIPVTVPAASLTAPRVTGSVSGSSVELAWAPVAHASRYRVYASTRTGGWRAIASSAHAGWHGQTPYSGATFRVAAENSGDYVVTGPIRPTSKTDASL